MGWVLIGLLAVIVILTAVLIVRGRGGRTVGGGDSIGSGGLHPIDPGYRRVREGPHD